MRSARTFLKYICVAVGVVAATTGRVDAGEIDLWNATVADIHSAFAEGLSAEQLTVAYLARIAAYDKHGPRINAVIALNDAALDEARKLDRERASGTVRGPLHGIPVVLKDKYDTFDLPTTAGSQLLEGHVPADDANVVAKLRGAGAIVLAKVNLSEWAGSGGSVSGAKDPEVLRAGRPPNGFSSAGGQTLNPHDLTRGPSGSSGGTGAAIAAGFAPIGLGA
jgi:amidase